MTHDEVMTLDRIVGRMEEAISALKTQVPSLQLAIERNRQERQMECARHWEVTNRLSASLSATSVAHAAIDTDAKAARERVLSESVAAASRVTHDAAERAEEKASRDAVIAEAVAAVAKATQETLLASTIGQRTQRHWIIERILPFVLPVVTAAAAWILAKS